ncbi:hypothetical protein COV24_03465 [candidate division WWE3 bacterium CG10_big_fil_rev_8_21_14_0_10_32_10]|uniref:Uncharacterized protein n=1 Tax=candidate division WWE3 bacterium CG10_big_fil_rev_8_21_14_0_10_32_10 TaxID=1975090 RepID=A0A2H0R9S8_UNCKA|nr:MAG: hypothetical protein COV24_03465 [candidate division WWE3 bacterium CG10_big_fil_rev_8_21_14_0_10_32_10]
MTKIRICVDMDDVLADLMPEWVKLYRLKTNDKRELNITEWEIHKSLPAMPKNEVYDLLNEEGLFLNCKPIEGAINGLTKVISDDRFKLIILTSAASKYAFSEKLKWMKNYFGSGILPHVFASSSSKSKNMLSDCYDVIIDDSGHVMKSLKDSDVVKILFDRPHNKELPEDLYDYRVYSWPEIIDKLEKIWTGKKIPQSMT